MASRRCWEARAAARKAIGFERSATSTRDAAALQTSSLSTIGARYELPLYLAGALSGRARLAMGTTYRQMGFTGELA